MIGETIEARGGVHWTVWFFCALAIIFVALAYVAEALDLAILAVLPALLGLFLAFRRAPHFSAEFTAQSVFIHAPESRELFYNEMEGLIAPKRSTSTSTKNPTHYEIIITDGLGTVTIPAKLERVRSDEVYDFLYERFPEPDCEDAPKPLREYLDKQIATFGPKRVWSFYARRHRGELSGRGTGLLVGFAILLAGIAWVIFGSNRHDMDGWVGIGIGGISAGVLTAFIFAVLSGYYQIGGRIKNWKRSGVILSPLGLALIQGDIAGEMEWEELKNVGYNSKHGPSSQGKPPGHAIRLDFGDINVWIADIYNCPLRTIYDRILEFWEG